MLAVPSSVMAILSVMSSSGCHRRTSRFYRGEVVPRNVKSKSHSQCSQVLLRRHALILPAILMLGSSPAACADEGTVMLVQQADVENLSGYLRQVLEYNQRIQRQNNAPKEFPSFVRDKFDITIVADGFSQAPDGTVKPATDAARHSCHVEGMSVPGTFA